MRVRGRLLGEVSSPPCDTLRHPGVPLHRAWRQGCKAEQVTLGQALTRPSCAKRGLISPGSATQSEDPRAGMALPCCPP